MGYRLKGDVTLSDEDFDRMADEAERGDYSSTPDEWIVHPQGSPSLDDRELMSITLKMTKIQKDALDKCPQMPLANPRPISHATAAPGPALRCNP